MSFPHQKKENFYTFFYKKKKKIPSLRKGGVPHLCLASALWRVAGDHHVTDLDAGHTDADNLNHRGGLVAQHKGEQTFRVMAVQRVDVGVTQRVADHLHPHLPSLGRLGGAT